METRKSVSRVLLALCLTLLMTLGLFGTWAFAADTDGLDVSGAIQVSGVENDASVTVYQLIDINAEENADGNSHALSYTWTTEAADWVRQHYPAYIEADSNGVLPAFHEANAADAAGFYKQLAEAVKAQDPSLSLAAGTCTGNGKIDNLKPGVYLLLINNGTKIYSPSAVDLVPEWDDGQNAWKLTDAAVNVKSSEATIVKTVKAPGTENGQEADNANIGDTVTFDLVADVPKLSGGKTFSISDSLPGGLDYNEGSLIVSGVSGEEETKLAAGQDYTLQTDDGSSTFTLTFSYTKTHTYEKIHVTYTATLNANAVVGEGGNVNEARLEYGSQSKEDTAAVYTYGLDISKVDRDNHTLFLSGAEFKLYASQEDAADSSNPIAFILSEDGVYRKAMPGEDGEVTTKLAVGSQGDALGRLTLLGLDEGTWYLKETKAPKGYNPLAGPVTVTITDAENGRLDGKVNSAAGEEEKAALAAVTVENSSEFQLPVTGGMGTFLFTAVGVVLMGAAAILLAAALIKKKAGN